MNTKERILRIAKEEFIEMGYQKASLRAIASKCEISATALYRHYASKEDIFNAVIQPVMEDFQEMASYVEQMDYSLLEADQLEEMWSFENTGEFHFSFLFTKNKDLIQLIVKERKPWFKSYIVGVEREGTFKYLKRMKELGYRVKEFDDKAFTILIDSYLEAYLNLLYIEVSDERLHQICTTINEFYTVGFRNLLGF